MNFANQDCSKTGTGIDTASFLTIVEARSRAPLLISLDTILDKGKTGEPPGIPETKCLDNTTNLRIAFQRKG